MIDNFPASLALVLQSEGGFSNHPADPGQMTMLGVTKKVWEAWVKHPVDEAEMRALTPEMVGPLYKAQYWDACHCSDLPLGVDYAVFDSAVNMGSSRAAKLLQTALEVKADGIIGRATIAAATAADPVELLEAFSLGKEAFYQSLPTFGVFGKGWLNRVAHVQDAAEGMIG
ncbi:MAG: glycosyl hydrolase 108 family protein [Alcaligenaceae bacterium]